MLRLLRVTALVLVAAPSIVLGQATTAQHNIIVAGPRPTDDSTLVGMHAVHLSPGGNSLDSALFQDFALELRKAGIRIVPPEQPADAQMYLAISKLRCGLGGCDGLFSIEVDQQEQVVRLNKIVPATTWLSQALGLGVMWNDWTRATAKQQTDEFLNRWLSANGR